MTYWDAQGSLMRPATGNSIADGPIVHIKALRPLSNCQGFAVHGESLITALIVRLLFTGRPAAIIGLIIAVVILSIDLAVRWTRSHVRIEGFETVTPALTHRDASTTIILVSRCLRIEATVLRMCPRSIFAALPTTMLSEGLRRDLPSIAPTASGPAVNQSVAVDDLFGSAGASTSPSGRLVSSEFENGPSAEYLPCQVLKEGHRLHHYGRSSRAKMRRFPTKYCRREVCN